MLDIEKIRDLVEIMETHDLVEIKLKDGEEEVSLRRPEPATGGQIVGVGPAPLAAQPAPAAESASPTEAESDADKDADLVHITAPMVGTFYAGPDPDSPSFVEVGKQVDPETVVCLLEAMKVFNEIKAETVGTIERVLVKSSDAVEYGQPLFAVRPL